MKPKDKCNILLNNLVGADNVYSWWNSPNLAFNNRLPRDVDIDEVLSYLIGAALK